ncbi:MAG: EVE domain-containing protein [Thermomicrobiales bacterium]
MAETSSTPTYWIIVGSIDNFRQSQSLDFTVQGMKSRHRKKAERMSPGDKIVYYVTGIKAFGAIATITSPYYESHERIWQSGNPKKEAEDYPFRVEVEPDLLLDEADFLPAESVARRMHYVSKWPAANWTLAFQGNVHEIGADDFQLIRDEMETRIPAAAGGTRSAH